MPNRSPTQKDILAQHSAALQDLARAVAQLAESQQEIRELLAAQQAPPPPAEPQDQAVDDADTQTVVHSSPEPKTFVRNAEHRFTFHPGINKDVPPSFAHMYEQWLDDCHGAEAHAQELAERKTYDEQSRLLAHTKTPMR